jgi:hypothetical protein
MRDDSMRLAAKCRPDLIDRMMFGDLAAQRELEQLAESFDEAATEIEAEDLA